LVVIVLGVFADRCDANSVCFARDGDKFDLQAPFTRCKEDISGLPVQSTATETLETPT
jgi:hypothetical protein